MSRSVPTQVEELALEIDCYCNPRGTWCITNSGKWASWLHTFRTYPVYTAMGIAYEDCEKSHLEDIARRTNRLRESMRSAGVDEEAIEEILKVMERRWYW